MAGQDGNNQYGEEVGREGEEDRQAVRQKDTERDRERLGTQELLSSLFI